MRTALSPRSVQAAVWLQRLAMALAVVALLRSWMILAPDAHRLDQSLPWLGLAVLGLALASIRTLPRFTADDMRSLWPRIRVDLACIAVVLAIGIFMRLYRLDVFPAASYFGFEEPQTGALAESILNNNRRPIEFAVTNYAAALGFNLLGFSTDGLRIVFLVLGIASLAPFYLLLRLLVSRPVALTGACLLAACRWDAITPRFADELFFGLALVIPAAYLLLLTFKTGQPLAALALGMLTGLLNYEYDSYRMLPYFIAAAMVIWVAVQTVPWLSRYRPEQQQPGNPRLCLAVFALAVLLTSMQLLAALHNGDNVYLEAFSRHRGEDVHTTLFGLLPEIWRTKLRWLMEVYLPFGARTYPKDVPLHPRNVAMLDPITAMLALAAAWWALVSWQKQPLRLLFAGWLLIGLLTAGVYPRNFYVGRFTGLLPPLFVLIACLLDDVWRLTARLNLARYSSYALGGLVALVLALNFVTLDRQIDDPEVQRSLLDPVLDACDFATGLGGDYTYLWTEDTLTYAPFVPTDYRWACRGFQGEALNTPLPVQNDAAAINFVFVTKAASKLDPAATLRWFYPALEGPVKTLERRGSYTLTAYRLSAAALQLPPSLGGQAHMETAPPGSSTVTWRGIVLLREPGQYALAPATATPVRVLLDGVETYNGAASAVTALDLAAGWHYVTLELPAGTPALPALRWRTESDDQPLLLEPGDLLAVPDSTGWLHQVSGKIGSSRGVSWRCIEPAPMPSPQRLWLPSWVTEGRNGQQTALLTREVWSGTLVAPADGNYLFSFQAQAAQVFLSLDDQIILNAEPPGEALRPFSAGLFLSAGEHKIMLISEAKPGPRSGIAGWQIGGADGTYIRPY